MKSYDERLEDGTKLRIAMIKRLAKETKTDEQVVATAMLAFEVFDVGCEISSK